MNFEPKWHVPLSKWWFWICSIPYSKNWQLHSIHLNSTFNSVTLGPIQNPPTWTALQLQIHEFPAKRTEPGDAWPLWCEAESSADVFCHAFFCFSMFFEVKTGWKKCVFFFGIAKNACLTIKSIRWSLGYILKNTTTRGVSHKAAPPLSHPESHLQLQVLQRWPAGPQKETRTYCNHPFFRGKNVSFREGKLLVLGMGHPTLQWGNPYYWGDDYP